MASAALPLVLVVSVATVCTAWLIGEPHAIPVTDIASLQRWIAIDSRDMERLARRGVVVRSLPAADRQVGVVAATRVSILPDAFMARVRGGGDLKKAGVFGRFSDPPALSDLGALSLDQGDVDRLRICRPRDCRFNFSDSEIATVRQALRDPQSGPSPAAQETFRRVVLDRAIRYRSGGLAALPPYEDRAEPVRPAAVFSEILRQIPPLTAHAPRAAAYLEQFPSTDTAGVHSSLTWSKVMMNNKAVVAVTHVAMFQSPPAPGVAAVLVARKQVYASRYMNGELMLTMLFAGSGGMNHLVVVHRSQLDELGGMFSGMKRSAIEGRIKDEAAVALAALRDDLERVR